MAEAALAVTAGSGTNVHTNSRTIAAATMLDQFVLPGEYPYATYSVIASNISVGTANDHILQIMAGASLNVRIRRIFIEQATNGSSGTLAQFSILRLTTAGTGGTAVTPAKFDTADSAAGATGMTLASSKGTESTELMRTYMPFRQAISTTQTQIDETFQWVQSPNGKPIIIAAGTSNGIAIKSLTAITTATVGIYVEIVETAFV